PRPPPPALKNWGLAPSLRGASPLLYRARKRLDNNERSDWELRIQDFRVFYDVEIDSEDDGDERGIVKIKAVGHKVHNILRIGDREVPL
ncbi:MAG: type II toxin-antitoxin system RelE family toxin, partial [Isosphaeraceae bacterium]